MSIETGLQPPLLQKRNQSLDITSVGNKEGSMPDLQQTIANLRGAYPLMADQIDQMLAENPSGESADPKLWLFMHTQLIYMQEFKNSNKNPEFFAPPNPPSSLTISASELQNLRTESKQFVEDNLDDLNDNYISKKPIPRT